MQYLGVLMLLLGFTVTEAQPFITEITEFKNHDKVNPPSAGQILFIGSSSIRMWKELDADFPAHNIINRGFGGSTLVDVIRYTNDIVISYKPRQIVVYCGENDLADGASPDSVLSRFTRFFHMVRQQLPETHIVFISIKPSPSRVNIIRNVEKANFLIENFLKQEQRTAYVNIFPLMLDGTGKPREELFLKDRLHMNTSGYAIWKRSITPVLK